jgi:DNA-binding SARP family transcriptional activator
MSLLWVNSPREQFELSQIQSLCNLIELRLAKDCIEAVDMSAMH